MPVRLLAVTDPRCPASTRYRVAQFEGFLASRGIQVDICALPDGDQASTASAQASFFDRVAASDTVVFQRCLPRPSTLREIRRRVPRLIYDFDDAIVYTDSTRRAPRHRLRAAWRFRRMIRCCDGVTAGNPYLAALARSYGARGNVTVIPTAVEIARYKAVSSVPANGSSNRSPAGNAHGDEPRPIVRPIVGPILGWIGSRSTLPYLEALRAPLTLLARQMPGLTVRVISDRYPNLGRVPVEWVPWTLDTEIEELKRFQIGLAPLPEDRWTRGKCGLRLLQYMAASVPAVASPVGTQEEVTAAGAAIPASSDADWVRAVQGILSDGNLAAGLAERGHELARQRFDAATLSTELQAAWCGSA